MCQHRGFLYRAVRVNESYLWGCKLLSGVAWIMRVHIARLLHHALICRRVALSLSLACIRQWLTIVTSISSCNSILNPPSLLIQKASSLTGLISCEPWRGREHQSSKPLTIMQSNNNLTLVRLLTGRKINEG